MHQTSLPSTTAEQSPALPVHGAHGSRRLRVLVVGTLLLTLTVTWLLVAVLLNTKWQDAVRSQERQNANLARVLEEQTLRVLAAADQATLRVAAEVRSGEFSEQDYALFANETGLAPDILTQLSIVGPDGRFVGSNLDPSAARNQDTDLSEREHIRVHLEPGKEPRARTRMSASGLFVGRPVTGRVSGRRTMQLSRPIVGSNRYLHGVVVASLNPGYFEQVYGSVDIGAQGAVALMGADFNVLARVIGAQAESIDKTIEFPPGHPLTDTTRTQGTYQRVSHIDGLGRITAFHRVPGYPLTVLVSTTDDEALAEWKTMRTFTVVFAGLFSATLIALGAGFLRGLHQLEQKNLALAASEAQARSANRAKSEFLTAISHELRTPLTSIHGFAELMEQRLEQPSYREAAGLIRSAAEHLNTLLSEILDLAKVQAGAMPIVPGDHAVRELVGTTVDLFAISAVQKGLTLEMHIAPGVPQVLRCDGLRLKQILNNLLSNALKFTREGGVRLETDTADGHSVRFRVTDTGPGIPADLHEVIFEKFSQGSADVSTQHGGTGLGLALSRGLAELMGGRLTVASEPGQGACFTLELPMHPPAADGA
ncbi:ATP-binding protein [Paracidovorax citrulli]|uniref:Virulence sensor protein BvgS n=2 Tax=Paracidovorax citrulli TaxID=80869 RepID=A1TRR9_PARC0|nr:ATP-binding protein [Paracidovorax citrulli]ABM33657.1 integral membrane sensor signal transduction histidine kinase [Paracidovorax citrulli AAC00-1]ATG94262.1 two-component sensor histidine kinase [Paracidovorax citrulli]PVY63088.1 signal transduction histidine kinase [Paracidovorax citrulli]QCX12612.1 Signal transduction histidine-protein kinase BarA [Paracidovorax citrulli]REG67929.1 signal transduction histidine kinase [Paracidovorax citrulli]